MPHFVIPSRRTRQPQGVVPRFSADIPAPTFCYLPSLGLTEIARGKPGAKASGDSLRGTTQGVAYKVARATNGGLDFGVHAPITGDYWTMLAFANPTSADGVSSLFSQRTGTTPFYQMDFLANAGTSSALATSAGNLQVVCYNSAAYVGYTASGTVVDGNWHVYVATRGRDGSTSNIDLYSDGAALTTTVNGSVVSSYGGTQKVNVGNLGDYTTNNVYCSSCDFALVAVWNQVLNATDIARLTPSQIWGVLFAPDRRVLYFGAGGGTTTITESVAGRLRAKASDTSAPIRTEAVTGARKARGAATAGVTLRSEAAVGRVKARGTSTATQITSGQITESVAGRRTTRAAVTSTPIRTEAVVARRQARASDTVSSTRTESVVGRSKARGGVTAAPVVAGMITESVAGRLRARASSAATTTRIEAVAGRRQARATDSAGGIRVELAVGRSKVRAAISAGPYVAPTLPVEIPESSRTIGAQTARLGASPVAAESLRLGAATTRKAPPRLG